MFFSVPLSQVKTLYDNLDNNKENKKPPKEKENKTKENEEKKKQQKQQQSEKKKHEPKEKPPKSIKDALNMVYTYLLNLSFFFNLNINLLCETLFLTD